MTDTVLLTIDGGKPVVEVVIQNDRAGLYGEEHARGVRTHTRTPTHTSEPCN